MTPGPWELSKTEGYSCGCVVDSRGWNIRGRDYMVFHLPTAGRCDDSAEADAKLMSASPELLLACRLLLEATGELVESADCDPDSPDAVNILGAVATARDAIAKATAR